MSDTDKPLTMEELADAKRYIEDRKASNNDGTYCLTYDGTLRLVAAAERSCKRPIATAPRDGTMIFGCDKYGNWHVCNWLGDVEGEIGQWFDQQSWDRDLVAWLPIPGEGGV